MLDIDPEDNNPAPAADEGVIYSDIQGDVTNTPSHMQWPIATATVRYAHEADTPVELSIKPGMLLMLLQIPTTDDDWCFGWLATDGPPGWIPSSYIENIKLVESSASDDEGDNSDATAHDTNDEVANAASKKAFKRRMVAQEILETETLFTMDLKMLCESYLVPMRRRVGDLFDESHVCVQFGLG